MARRSSALESRNRRGRTIGPGGETSNCRSFCSVGAISRTRGLHCETASKTVYFITNAMVYRFLGKLAAHQQNTIVASFLMQIPRGQIRRYVKTSTRQFLNEFGLVNQDD